MRRLSLRFEVVRITIGGFVMTLAGGLFGFLPATRAIAAILFCLGVILTVDGLVTYGKSGVIVHRKWSLQKVMKALESAPERATIQILQTWFPEENFVTSLERLYRVEGKRFHLHVMIIDPRSQGAVDVLGARVKVRGIDRTRAAGEVTGSLDNLLRLKRTVDTALRSSARNGDTPETVDLQIRLYDFLPFGPIYKIGEEVMFVGFFLSHVSSVDGPMIEVRKKYCPDLWHVFEEDFRRGWEASASYSTKARSRSR